VKKIILLGIIAITLVALPVLGGCGKELPPKDEIVIGAARPMSGSLAFFEENAFGPLYKMWVDEVNADGGIYVEEYGKKLPVRMRVYDDKSDMATMTRLLEKLITEDEVDFIFPPASTAFFFAAAGVADKYDMILMTGEGGAKTIMEMIPDMPYFFGLLNFSNWNQIPTLAEILEDEGVDTVGVIYIDDLFGIEYSTIAREELAKKNIDIVMEESIPLGIKDVSPILKQAQALNPDALLLFCYPDENFLAVGQMLELDYSPNFLLLGPGGNFEIFRVSFGDEIIEGIVGFGAWNTKTNQALDDFVDRFLAAGYDFSQLDWWGHAYYYAGLEILEQAIEKAGTLDHKEIRDIMTTEHFDTVLGDTWFDNQLLAIESHPGEIGQWQDGVFEVIDANDKRTADPIYPKPAWP
jgi:branched-chain amino acid transport system substrate-binding protein